MQYDVVLCTGGLHHLPFARQTAFLRRVAQYVKPSGFALIGDPYIDDYANEAERKLSVVKLGYEYIRETIRNGATDDVLAATVDIVKNDLLLVEFKTAVVKILPVMRSIFSQVELERIWPDDSAGYGDYLFTLRR